MNMVSSLDRPHFAERFRRMATAAVGSEFAVMYVVSAVTIAAALTES